MSKQTFIVDFFCKFLQKHFCSSQILLHFFRRFVPFSGFLFDLEQFLAAKLKYPAGRRVIALGSKREYGMAVASGVTNMFTPNLLLEFVQQTDETQSLLSASHKWVLRSSVPSTCTEVASWLHEKLNCHGSWEAIVAPGGTFGRFWVRNKPCRPFRGGSGARPGLWVPGDDELAISFRLITQ